MSAMRNTSGLSQAANIVTNQRQYVSNEEHKWVISLTSDQAANIVTNQRQYVSNEEHKWVISKLATKNGDLKSTI